VDWAWNASAAHIRQQKQRLVDVSLALGEIVGPNGGTYLNEANPYEPDWESVFWGPDKYQRLLRVKRRVDPTGLMTCNRCVGGAVVYDIDEP
jgi:FAD/FMN-containing dehydrogenase